MTTIVLGSDGRHVTLSRYTVSQAERDEAAAKMLEQGLSGWVCEMDGEYYSRRKVSLVPVQQIGGPADFFKAQAAFLAIRKAATK